MADLLITIPDSSFTAGKPFADYGTDENTKRKVSVAIGLLSGGNPVKTIKWSRDVRVKQNRFQFQNSTEYSSFISLVLKGFIEVREEGGLVQSVSDLITIYKNSFQEL